MEKTIALHIDPAVCQSCIRCEASLACRRKVIVQIDPGEQPYLDAVRCLDCRVCVAACPFGAVRKGIQNG